METDADRRAMLLAVGGQKNITVNGATLSVALFTSEPLDLPFDGLRVSTDAPQLACLMSEVRQRDLKNGDAVVVPDEGEFWIADIGNESGLAVIPLRKEP